MKRGRSTGNPTKAQRARWDDIHELGCVPRHHMTSLTADQVRELRVEYAALRANGRLPNGAMKSLQQKYRLSDTAITNIGRGRTWRKV